MTVASAQFSRPSSEPSSPQIAGKKYPRRHSTQGWPNTCNRMCPRTWSGRYAVCLGEDLPSQCHWTDQLVGPNNAYLVKRKTAGGSQFSKDPLNLMNKHSRKVKTLHNSLRVSNINANVVCRIRQQQGTYSQNDDIEDERRRRQWMKKTDLENMIQAVGVQPGEKGGVRLLTKKTKHLNRPSANGHEVSWSGQKGGPKSVSPLIQSFNTAANITPQGFIRESSTTLPSRDTEPTSVEKPLLVPAPSSSQHNRRKRTLSQSYEVRGPRRRRRRRNEWV